MVFVSTKFQGQQSSFTIFDESFQVWPPWDGWGLAFHIDFTHVNKVLCSPGMCKTLITDHGGGPCQGLPHPKIRRSNCEVWTSRDF